ncbi:hypothetical protein [Vibrio sp. R78045]|uniref:secretion/conjugation apparatus DotM-related subunit n=1 Tax=Vibrio sp. R78045 TaxID=3093868 RepID=UPI0036F3392C
MNPNHNEPTDVRYIFTVIMTGLMVFGAFILVLYSNKLVFIQFWRVLRILELMVWDSFASLFSVDFFKHWLGQLMKTPPTRINWNYISKFEASLNEYLRWVYTPWLIYVGYCFQRNIKKVRGVFNVQTLIEQYGHENDAIKTLAEDNPLMHSRVFDFDNRNDFHNRHAQAISPQRYVESCPPPCASIKEMQKHHAKINVGKPSPYRPIAIIDRKSSSVDFNRTVARTSLERQLTSPPTDGGYYLNEDSPARLFDKDGNMVELVKVKAKDKTVRIVGGFAECGLINNGREYNGTAAQLRYAFNSTERKIFDFLCRRYKHPNVDLAKFVLELTKRHAYTKTYLVEFLNVVDIHNTVASTEFYLMQREDRALYFALYSAREEKPFYEAIGVMSHYHMEKLIGMKLVTPYVNPAINTLEFDARRIANKKPPRLDLIRELDANMLADADLKEARAFVDSDDTELTSLLKRKNEVYG